MKLIETYTPAAGRLSLASSAPISHQLVIFPHAGGDLSFYRAWRSALPPEVDLIIMLYPHSQQDAEQEKWRAPETAIRHCERSLNRLLGIAPVTLFGHSMGAILALHLAKTLAGSRFQIEQLIVSSQCPPSTLSQMLKSEQDIEYLKDQALSLGEVNGISALDESTRQYLGEQILSDLRLLQKLSALSVDNLPHTRIFGGQDDPLVDRQNLNAWSGFLPQTTEPVLFPGGHFYLSDALDSVIDAILQPYRSNHLHATFDIHAP
ncbi:thioesterase II family protein [Photobacterium arenosum]|uniref:thioesterase II family protein n=1 Tax=Photobacterium arenosum TaxID=2774143 RepID=UPI00288B0135|nr:thioesterase domain-containing protein [Photobacterium arenosum]